VREEERREAGKRNVGLVESTGEEEEKGRGRRGYQRDIHFPAW